MCIFFPNYFKQLCIFFVSLCFSFNVLAIKKEVIIGGGHVGLIQALQLHLKARENNEDLRITIMDRNQSIQETTAANIWNSHTPDEIVAVIPPVGVLLEKLKIPFDVPGGIYVYDVAGIMDSLASQRFINEVVKDGPNHDLHKLRTETLLTLGRAGMALWADLYKNADDKLKTLLGSCNFNACYENKSECSEKLGNGYRIDLIYGVPNAQDRALAMRNSYQELGYRNSRILTPDEVLEKDPFLADFCQKHSILENGVRTWRDDAVALWRPGGCLDTEQFLPKLKDYLTESMGTYISNKGIEKNRFNYKVNREVTKAEFDNQGDKVFVKGLSFADGTSTKEKASYDDVNYTFCPGEGVGTLEMLGFQEPAYAGFAGASLSLRIPFTEQMAKWESFNHYMEVHKDGIVLAWQGRTRIAQDGTKEIFLGGAGTKAYYGDVRPQTHEAFAKTNNLLQLNMFNEVLPELLSHALRKDTKGQILTEEDMLFLENKGIAKRWVGRRAVTFDGFATIGQLYTNHHVLNNAQTITHLGSGGGSFSLIMTLLSNYFVDKEHYQGQLDALGLGEEFIGRVQRLSSSLRVAK